jgi:hypothetical protein
MNFDASKDIIDATALHSYGYKVADQGTYTSITFSNGAEIDIYGVKPSALHLATGMLH